jgi:hypothetical protein
MKEGIDFKLVPSIRAAEMTDDDKDWHWQVRILAGDYEDTLLEFGTVRINEEDDCANFDFEIVESPDRLLTTEDTVLQELAGKILLSVIEKSIEDWKEKDTK